MASLAIVGAGVAGLSAAISAARLGAAPHVYERKREVGSLYKSTGGIASYWIRRIPLEINYAAVAESPIDMAVIHGPRSATVIRAERGAALGYVLNQPRLEKQLAKMAERYGATIHTGVEVKGLGDLRGYSHVIGADGVFSKIAQETVGLPPWDEIYKCAEYWIDVAPDRALHLFSAEYCPRGYIWVFPGDGYIKVGAGIPLTERVRVTEILDRFLRERPEFSGKIIGRAGGCVPTPTPLDSVVPRESVALVGDAGRLVNPATGGGLHLAILSGYMAGRSASLDDVSPGFGLYDRWYKDEVRPQLMRWWRLKPLAADPGLIDRALRAVGEELTVRTPVDPMKELARILPRIFFRDPGLALRVMGRL